MSLHSSDPAADVVHDVVTPRRWLDQCNPGLSKLISDTLRIDRGVWLKDLYKLEGLLQHADDPTFQKKWAAIKQSNKQRLAKHIEMSLGVKLNTNAMFDIQIKVSGLFFHK